MGEEGEATEFDHSWGKDDPRHKLPGWKEVPDAEPTTLDEIHPYTEGVGGKHNCLVLRAGDTVNITLDLDDKTLWTEDEMKLQIQACKDWYKKDLRKAFGVTDKAQWKKQLGVSYTGCGKYGSGYKMGMHLVLNDYTTLWEHTLHSPEMQKALETCPMQWHSEKEGSKVVDNIYSKVQKLHMVGARKPDPDSQFVKKMSTLKSNLAAHIPTLLTGDETMIMPTPDAVQQFEREQSTSHIKNNIPKMWRMNSDVKFFPIPGFD